VAISNTLAISCLNWDNSQSEQLRNLWEGIAIMRGTALNLVHVGVLTDEHFALCRSIWMNFTMNQALAI
jgi:CMP-2-keto-3-deoxyoctulosonic acid synthetase